MSDADSDDVTGRRRTRNVRRRSRERDEPREWDCAKPTSDDLRSANRAEVARTYADLAAAEIDGTDDAAKRLRFAKPASRTLLARRFRARYLERDDEGDDDDP
ncbi:hypothetical protein [Natrinema marinum]|uniref:hypothetical protein n=1 Tax=Natrinema marinum TaxID=2961598 RepID=UPI0020C8382D|nr:hypothetical protein [Natrinema marinum]